MPALDKDSTYTDALKAYKDNSYYDANDSASEARLFIQACRVLLALSPEHANHGNRNEIRVRTRKFEQQMREAKQWLVAHSNDYGGVTYASFNNFR
jgi:hypothetical protein